MSTGSYTLSKRGGKWFATGKLPSGRTFEIDCGAGSRDRADGFADVKVRERLRSSQASVEWHRKSRAEKDAHRAKLHPSHVPTQAPTNPEPRASSEAPASPRATDEELRAKLLARGAAAAPPPPDNEAPAIEADEIIPPGQEPDDEDPPVDTEGAELIAGLLAKAGTIGVVWIANRPLKKRRPPMRGEPHEKGLEWFHDGLEYNLTKLVGKTATLGPTGKMLSGAAIIFASVWMTAEPIDGAAAAPPPAPPAEAAPPAHANGTAPPEAPAPGVALSLGSFGVQERRLG